MLKAVCIVVLVVCVGLLIYTFINAYYVSKRNKATDEVTRTIFMSQVLQSQKDNESSETDHRKPIFNQQNINNSDDKKRKELNFDEYDEEPLEEVGEGQHLKDFLKKNDD